MMETGEKERRLPCQTPRNRRSRNSLSDLHALCVFALKSSAIDSLASPHSELFLPLPPGGPQPPALDPPRTVDCSSRRSAAKSDGLRTQDFGLWALDFGLCVPLQIQNITKPTHLSFYDKQLSINSLQLKSTFSRPKNEPNLRRFLNSATFPPFLHSELFQPLRPGVLGARPACRAEAQRRRADYGLELRADSPITSAC